MVREGKRTINIKTRTDDGRPYPDFLLSHVQKEWAGVDLPLLDPDICLKVDSSLSYCGCQVPKAKLRQLVYVYHQSSDFDHETIALLTRIGACVEEDAACWDEVIAIEFQRDCGLSRKEYLQALEAIAEHAEAPAALVEELMTA